MMIRLPVLLALLLPVAADAAPAKRDAQGKPCTPPVALRVDAQQATARVRKLGEMPPANQMLIVYREIGGCARPVVLREGIGGGR